MLLTPQDVAKAANDIVSFWQESELSDTDKEKILTMVQDYYEAKDEYVHEQYLAALTKRTVEKRVPKTGFESDDTEK